jgi:hypothetical protein
MLTGTGLPTPLVIATFPVTGTAPVEPPVTVTGTGNGPVISTDVDGPGLGLWATAGSPVHHGDGRSRSHCESRDQGFPSKCGHFCLLVSVLSVFSV